MSTDFENELRDLFREKAADAPLATPSVPASAPQRVLRRGRLHQVGTVLGSVVVVAALIVGSVAGLTRILGDGGDDRDIGDGGYEVFQRTATIEAFTVTSPSDWYLVNQWPRSMSTAVGSGSASETCTMDPSGNEACVSEPQRAEELEPQPYGLPMFRLTNWDLGLGAIPCGAELGDDTAVLYVALDAEAAIRGVRDPSIGPWPGVTSDSTEPVLCGPGRYTRFTVNGEPFFAWAGFGPDVTDEDRATVLQTLESLTVDNSWSPSEPAITTPAYVIAGGTLPDGSPWRLDLRPGPRSPELFLEGVDRSLLGVEEGHGQDTVVPAIPIESCCSVGTTEILDVTFGFVRKEATGVEFRPIDTEGDATGPAQPGRIAPLPPTLADIDADLFFIEGTGGVQGMVVALGVDTEENVSPPPTAEPRDEVVELSGTFEGQPWTVRFTGAFAERTACIRVTINETYEPSCHGRVENSLASSQPSSDAWVTDELYLEVTSVVPEVVELRFVSDDDAIVPSQSQCAMGPLGWTNPDRRVCAIVFPSAGSGTLEYLGADGTVLFEEGIAWGAAEPEPPTPVEPVHGGTYWAVYPWVGAAGAREADDVSAQLLAEFGIEAFPGDLACDQGAAEALGTDAEQGIAVYFETVGEANEFALQAGLLGHEADPVIAHVKTYCLD